MDAASYSVARVRSFVALESDLLEHAIGHRQQGQGYLKAKCLRGLEIDGELKLCRCLYGKIIRLLPFQDAIYVRSRASNNFSSIRSIRDQRAFRNELLKTVDRREAVSL